MRSTLDAEIEQLLRLKIDVLIETIDSLAQIIAAARTRLPTAQWPRVDRVLAQAHDIIDKAKQ